jgi:hypothetical protein
MLAADVTDALFSVGDAITVTFGALLFVPVSLLRLAIAFCSSCGGSRCSCDVVIVVVDVW